MWAVAVQAELGHYLVGTWTLLRVVSAFQGPCSWLTPPPPPDFLEGLVASCLQSAPGDRSGLLGSSTQSAAV